jgi:hypothetical protein
MAQPPTCDQRRSTPARRGRGAASVSERAGRLRPDRTLGVRGAAVLARGVGCPGRSQTVPNWVIGEPRSKIARSREGAPCRAGGKRRQGAQGECKPRPGRADLWNPRDRDGALPGDPQAARQGARVTVPAVAGSKKAAEDRPDKRVR